MPQIDQIASIYASQLFWLVVVFALLYFGIGKAMVPKILNTVEDRNARITGDLAAAEAARAAADQAEATYKAKLDASRAAALVETVAAKARASAATEAQVRAAGVEIGTRLAHAEAALAAQLVAASSSIELVAADAARDMVERVAGLGVSADEAAGAVVAAAR